MTVWTSASVFFPAALANDGMHTCKGARDPVRAVAGFPDSLFEIVGIAT
jgi:hypothetical protein